MGGLGSLFAAVFGVIWTIAAANMGAPPIFLAFGVVFVVFGVIQAVYNFKNATGKDRYSSFDIVDSNEESDPLNDMFGRKPEDTDSGIERQFYETNEHNRQGGEEGELSYCPFCGAPLGAGFEYCGKCGKKLP